jgi:RpiR family glv operon transcriptional regulator
MDIEARARAYSQNLSETDREILSYILEHKEDVTKLGIAELSQLVHASKSSIIRLTKKLEFKGFSEMKFYLEQSMDKQQVSSYSEQALMQLQKQDLEQTNRLIQQTDFTDIIYAMYQAETIYCYGTGFSQKNSLSELSQAMMYKGKRILTFPAKREFDIKENIDMLTLRKIPTISITNLIQNYLSDKAMYNLFYSASPIFLTSQMKDEFYSFISLKLVIDTLIRKYFEYVR